MENDLLLYTGQKNIVTAEMKQSIKILQFSSQELYEFICKQVETNPVLEIIDYSDLSYESGNSIEAPVDWHEYYKNRKYDEYDINDQAYCNSQSDQSYENNLKHETTLREYLLKQLNECSISNADITIARFIIECIDENGYLNISKQEIASLLNIERKKIDKILQLVQSFDPPGVGARSLRECLILQLKSKNIINDELKTVVLEHLGNLANNNYEIIKKKTGISISKIKNMRDTIKSLEPKPGRIFCPTINTAYIKPDAFIRKVKDDYHVIINDCALPKLEINKEYINILFNSTDKDTAEYLKNKLNSAYFLLNSIEKRKNTVNKVIESIIKHQINFFDNGIMYLKPLKLKEVAEDINMHESTISRCINGKYIQTDRGTYELRFFFDNGVQMINGEELSSKAIKRMIQNMIKDENSNYPISDHDICENLKCRGIKISRRTVSKYREGLGIDNFKKRRRFE